MENLQLSRSYLNALARKIGNRQFANDEALLKHLLGTPGAVAVFVELHKWLPYSKNADGSIYKSDAELAQGTLRSAKTVERTRAKMKEAGFTIKVKKANGTPTNHYRFDLETFIAFAANKLKVTIEQMRVWILSAAEKKSKKSDVDAMSHSGNSAEHKEEVNPGKMSKPPLALGRNDSGQKDGVDSDILRASLTINKKTEETDRIQSNIKTATTEYPPYTKKEVVVDSSSLKMEIYSFAATLKIQYAMVERWIVQYGLERVKDVAKRAVEDPNVRNPGGWAKLALEKNYQWAEKIPTVPHHKSYTEGPYAAFIKS